MVQSIVNVARSMALVVVWTPTDGVDIVFYSHVEKPAKCGGNSVWQSKFRVTVTNGFLKPEA